MLQVPDAVECGMGTASLAPAVQEIVLVRDRHPRRLHLDSAQGRNLYRTTLKRRADLDPNRHVLASASADRPWMAATLEDVDARRTPQESKGGHRRLCEAPTAPRTRGRRAEAVAARRPKARPGDPSRGQARNRHDRGIRRGKSILGVGVDDPSDDRVQKRILGRGSRPASPLFADRSWSAVPCPCYQADDSGREGDGTRMRGSSA